MWTYNQVESVFKNIKYQKTKFNFTLIVFRLLSGPKFYWIWTVRLPCDILIEIWHITNLGHLVVNAK